MHLKPTPHFRGLTHEREWSRDNLPKHKINSIFPIVGIGASAGGLDAFLLLLKGLPKSTEMAFILVQHLDPTHPSLLREALASSASMPIRDIQQGMSVLPNNIYVMPQDVELEIIHNRLQLSPRDRSSGKLSLPINRFFRSLAKNSGSKAIGIVLSGSGSDGTEGLRTIKEFGGLTIAQKPKTARYSSMPESAIEASVIDFQLSISDIAKELVRLGIYLNNIDQQVVPFSTDADLLQIQKILDIVKVDIGIDFQEYKIATIKRRIIRRITILNINKLENYTSLLKRKKEEARLLTADLLIHVTSFFRDLSSFEKLKKHIFPEIVKDKSTKTPIRIWIAGCSSGEEVYSIITGLLDFLAEKKLNFRIQVFATDISEEMIVRARAGFYAVNLMQGLTAEQINKHFVKVEGGYKVTKSVRDLCIFVRHDLAKDPPFSKLDLICCRNVLIYFDQILQKKILSIFHYCLNMHGYLFLGKTENVTSNRELFLAQDKEDKIFSKVNIANKFHFHPHKEHVPSTAYFQSGVTMPKSAYGLSRSVDSLLLSEYAPCGVVVNEQMDVIEFRGKTSLFIQQASGTPEVNLFRMLHESIFIEVKIALEKVKKDSIAYRKEDIFFSAGDPNRKYNIAVREISTFSENKDKLYLILFEEYSNQKTTIENQNSKNAIRSESKKELLRSERLSNELVTTKAYLHTLNQSNQTINDALATANEELVSGNEELQSLNEEMETAKEELQSTNEELSTVNDELNNRNHELGVLNSDLVNLLNCVEIPILILGLQHEIRRFTPHARNILKLIPADIGRSIDDIKLNINIIDLNKQIDEVIQSDILKESDVQDNKGRWHRIQIRPYKNSNNIIDGVVISLIDINILKRALGKAEWACDYANRIVESIQIPLLVLDSKMIVLSANKAFYDIFRLDKKDTENKSLSELGISQWSINSLHLSLGKMLQKNTHFKNAEVEREFPRLGNRIMSLSAISVKSDPDMPPMILLAIEDITHRKTIEYERKKLLRIAEEAKLEAEKANRTKDVFLATLSHELRTPLTSLLLQTQILRRGKMDGAKILHSIDVIESAAKVQAQLIEDLLDISRIISGKLSMNKKSINFSELVRGVILTVGTYANTRQIIIESKIAEKAVCIFADEMRMKQVVWNLCNNAIKFSAKNTKIKIELKSNIDSAILKITDHGVGIDSEFIPKMFDRFSQSEDSLTRAHGGMGLGLAIVKYVLDMHLGIISVKSAGKNRGSCFTVKLPLIDQKPEELIVKKTSHKPQTFLALMGRRILIVDDDEATMEALRELLQQAGANVMIACSAAEAMRDVGEFLPSAIICDIAMPKEDGYSFMRKLRQMGVRDGGRIPAIALTAMAGEADRKKALEAGFQAHIAKPVVFEKLLELIVALFK